MIKQTCSRRLILSGVILLFGLFFSCSRDNSQSEPSKSNVTLNGAGATFTYPLYSRWTGTYQKLTGVSINYQSIGSGAGIAQIKVGTVDFGASDAPLRKETLEAQGLIQFPMIVGGITPVVHLNGIGAGDLRLTPEILAGIYLGHIKKWNDAEILRVNPGITLPDIPIVPIHRVDGSGTTWIFTNYLSKISPEWNEKVGNAIAISWPTGAGGKGNEGVSAYIQRINGAIGYVAFVYAVQNKFAYVKLQNQAGKFVEPGPESFEAAMSNADWANSPEFFVVLTNQPGSDTWPIIGPSFILLRKNWEESQDIKILLDFFDWCYHRGPELAAQLNYVALPQNVIEMVEDQWKKQIRVNGEPVWQ